MPKRKSTECETPSQPSNKRQRYIQHFKAQYSEGRPCIVESGLGSTFARCTVTVYASDFGVAHRHRGLFDVKRHLASTKHAQMVDIKNSQQTFYFNVPSENEGLTADVRAVITEALFSCWLVKLILIKSH